MKQLVYLVVFSGALTTVVHAMEEVVTTKQVKFAHDDGATKQQTYSACNSPKLSQSTNKQLMRKPSAERVLFYEDPLQKQDAFAQDDQDDGIAMSAGLFSCCCSKTQVTDNASKRKPLTECEKQLVERELTAFDTKILFHAVLNNIPQEVLYTVLCGYADVNKKDGIGWAPLHYAARDRNVIAMRILLAAEGIDITAKDGLGRTVRQVVESRRDCATQEHKALCDEMLALLAAHGTSYPYAIRGNALIELATEKVVLSARVNE